MHNKGLLLVLATAIISGIAIFLNKFGIAVISPFIFTGLKNVIVVVFVASWLLIMKDWNLLKSLSKKQWIQLIGIGLIGGSIPFLLFFKGLSMTSAAQAALIHKTLFFWAAVLALLFLKEKISKNFIILALALVIGNALLLKLLPTSFGLGDLLILAATLLWAFEAVLSKKALSRLPARIVIFGRMFFGTLFIILFWFISGQSAMLVRLEAAQLGWVLITAVFLFGYVATWYSGLKYLKVSSATAILTLGGIITSLLSYIILNQGITGLQAFGMLLIAFSLGLITWKKPREIAYVRN